MCLAIENAIQILSDIIRTSQVSNPVMSHAITITETIVAICSSNLIPILELMKSSEFVSDLVSVLTACIKLPRSIDLLSNNPNLYKLALALITVPISAYIEVDQLAFMVINCLMLIAEDKRACHKLNAIDINRHLCQFEQQLFTELRRHPRLQGNISHLQPRFKVLRQKIGVTR